MMYEPQKSEKTFLNSDLYSQFRSLICSERILLSNVYLRFNQIDLRPLLAGCLVAYWDESENMFVPKKNFLNELLLEKGILEIKSPENTLELKKIISDIRPLKDLIIIQQGAVINDQRLYTDIGIYHDGEKIITSVIREGLEGFNFDFNENHFKSYEIALDKKISFIRSEKLSTFFNYPEIFNLVKDLHNNSLTGNLLEIKEKMLEHVNANLSMSNENAEVLPTYIALKLCGPVCWYFNRFIQSCLGIQERYNRFNNEQFKLIEELNLASAKTRNMGLKLSRSQKDRDRIALEKLIYQLINQIDSLRSLIIM